MQELQLYIDSNPDTSVIDYVRVDLFKDETVSLTQTIQNVRDISKIFTEFSKTFSLPASKTNNKIFRHYYNSDINNGFDARNKAPSYIELNTIPFKEGYIKLEGVDLKNNVPHTYRITFFGNTINLPDVLGDDQLSTLSALANENLDYDYASIRTKLVSTTVGSNIICPLITHSQRLIYNAAASSVAAGNLYYNNATDFNGVLWSDLKYAIKLDFIIDAIQSQAGYNLTFSSNFFNNSANSAFNNLYMWLHRKKGAVEPTGQLQENFTAMQDLSLISGSLSQVNFTPNGFLELDSLNSGVQYVETFLDITPVTMNAYSIRVFRNGAQISELSQVTGIQRLFDTSATRLGAGTYSIQIASIPGQSWAAGGIKWTISIAQFGGIGGGGGTEVIGNSSTVTNSTTVQFAIVEQIPEMTIINFLTAIFKMFNLTAYVDNAGVIVVRTLDSYYGAGSSTPINIDSFLDVTKSTVNVALPFKEIVYRFKGLGTFLAKQYNQVNNLEWGTLKYTLDDNTYDAPTNTYKVEVPFEHVMYERLFPVGSSTATTIQYGYFTDDNQEPYYGLPLIFYAIRQVSGTAICLKRDTADNFSIDDYIIPSNSKTLAASASTSNINFGVMINEYSPSEDFTGTLFNNYYTTYISEVFNRSKRLTKVTAYLPLKIYYNLQLNDKLQIRQQNYKINSITTNLTNGKSEIELLNVTEVYGTIAVYFQSALGSLYFSSSIGVLQNLSAGDVMFTDTQLTTPAVAGTYSQAGSTSSNTYCNSSGDIMNMVLNSSGTITSISCDQP